MIISNKPVQYLLVTLLALSSSINFASTPVDSVSVKHETVESTEASHTEAVGHGESVGHEIEKEFNASELINSHIGDSHDFHIADWDGHPISFSLPVILWTNNGLEIFSSAKFHHDNSGEHVVDINGQKLVRYKEIIFYADKFETFLVIEKSKGLASKAKAPVFF